MFFSPEVRLLEALAPEVRLLEALGQCKGSLDFPSGCPPPGFGVVFNKLQRGTKICGQPEREHIYRR